MLQGKNTIVPAVVLAAGLTLAAAPAASPQEVGSATVVPMQVTGDPETRFTMVILGDGYTAADMGRFREHVDKHLNVLWSIEPFRSYRSYFNVYAVEIVSGESGITCDPDDPAGPQERDTPLGMAYGGGCSNPNARGIRADADAADRYAAMATPHYDQLLVIANTDTYGGLGGRVATTSGGNSLGPLITPHELGHSLGRLQDEYTYRGRGTPGGHYDGEEPRSGQHTILTAEEMVDQQAKWWRWLGEESESGGVIGRYEGGMGNVSGIWRPARHSMMISLGYHFDQVSRERMVQQISSHTELIAASTPTDATVAPDQVVWVETATPVYHELDVSWRISGAGEIGDLDDARHVELSEVGARPGDTISVTVVDPTDWVRDPEIRASTLTATRSWVVGDGTALAAAIRGEGATSPSAPVAFTAHTQTERPVGGQDVVYVETSQPDDRVLDVTWELNGRVMPNPGNRRTFDLGRQDLAPGTYTLVATVTDPANSGGPSESLSWTVDNVPPTVTYTLSQPVAAEEGPDGIGHYFLRDQFTMGLEAVDDQPGYVVAEFRVNGRGWHHYYGWPDAPEGTPFLFTPSGTNIKELIYGSLGAEGLSPQPWEAREPGWGTHTIEYRAIDAAGNISDPKSFRVTFRPSPSCDEVVSGRHEGLLRVSSGVTCLEGATVSGAVTVAPGASLVAVDARIDGGLTSSGAALVELVGTRVEGPVNVDGTTGGVIVLDSAMPEDAALR